jgi:class 3 adenylate cyclase
VSNSAATPLAYAYVNRIVLGLARLRARHIGGRVAALALWDGAPGRFGGTGSAVRDWQAAGQGVTCIAPRTLDVSELPPAERSAAPLMADGGQRIVSMLFGDAVGFSKLEDHQVSVFVERFLGAVSLLVEASGAAPLTCNTWGDGLYFCFEHPGDAAELALRICEMVRATDWHALGLSKEMDIRIALHAGPAYDCVNPVTKSRDFTGAHVSRAARIEPVTPPGQVYSSQAFAALCECFGLRDYVCDYVGQLPLAKGYGTFPTFHLRRSGGEPQAAATRQPAAVPAAPA